MTRPASTIRHTSPSTASRSSGRPRCTNHHPPAQSTASVTTVVALAARNPYRGIKARFNAMLIAAAMAVAHALRCWRFIAFNIA